MGLRPQLGTNCLLMHVHRSLSGVLMVATLRGRKPARLAFSPVAAVVMVFQMLLPR